MLRLVPGAVQARPPVAWTAGTDRLTRSAQSAAVWPGRTSSPCQRSAGHVGCGGRLCGSAFEHGLDCGRRPCALLSQTRGRTACEHARRLAPGARCSAAEAAARGYGQCWLAEGTGGSEMATVYSASVAGCAGPEQLASSMRLHRRPRAQPSGYGRGTRTPTPRHRDGRVQLRGGDWRAYRRSPAAALALSEHVPALRALSREAVSVGWCCRIPQRLRTTPTERKSATM